MRRNGSCCWPAPRDCASRMKPNRSISASAIGSRSRRIADHVGLHLAAFSSADAAAEHRRLAEAGFATLPLVDMRRPVATASGSEDARFTIARIAHRSMPEGRVQFLTHHTEPLVWRDGFLDPPNGPRALTGLWIAAADPAEPAERFV